MQMYGFSDIVHNYSSHCTQFNLGLVKVTQYFNNHATHFALMNL